MKKNGIRSRNEEIMWPSKPNHVAYLQPYLLSFSDRGIDVFHSRTGEWIQILQFPRVNIVTIVVEKNYFFILF